MNLDEELEAAKRILLDLQLEKEALLKSNNLAKFVPNPGGQTEFFNYCDTYLRAVFAGNRFGKPLENSTPVLTPKGWKPIKDIVIGDFVISGQGAPTKVTDVFPQGKIPLYRMYFDDNTWVDSGEDHIWTVYTGQARFNKTSKQYNQTTELTTKEILEKWGPKPSPKSRISLPTFDPIVFSPKNNKDHFIHPYTLGALIGDGCLLYKQTILTTSDPEILKFAVLPKGYKWEKIKSSKYSYSAKLKKRRFIRDAKGIFKKESKLIEAIVNLNLNTTSAFKFIPKEYLYSSPKSRILLLQGLMDTDGCANKNGSCEYCTISLQLGKDVLFLIRSLGLKATFTWDDYKFRINILSAPSWIFKLPRKIKNIAFKRPRRLNKVLTKIEKIPDAEATCICVESTCHTFIIKDFIVTHNSFIGCVEDVSWLLGERIFFPKDHPLRYKGIPQHGVKGYLVVANWDKSREIFTKEGDPATDDSVGKLFKFLPKDCWKVTGRNQGYVTEITVTARPYGIQRVSYIKIITTNAWKKDFLTAESGDIDFVHIDEPTEEALWNGLARGLVDRGGKAWWLMTAKSQPWMYYHMEDRIKAGSKNYWMYLGSQRENITLEEENIERFAEGLNDKARATAIDGVPSFKSNLVIYTFDERQHILDRPPEGWKDRLTPPEDWNVAVAIDTHPQTPHAVLMVAIAPSGDVVAFNERFLKGPIKGPNSIAEWLYAQPCFSRCQYLLLEPAAWNSDQITKRAFVEDFYEAGLSPIKGTKFRSEAIVKMCDRFGAISPKTTILTSCPVFIKEIKRWAFDKDDKPRDKDDHMLENFGRLLFYNDFAYIKESSNNPLTFPSDYHAIGYSEYKDELNLNYL